VPQTDPIATTKELRIVRAIAAEQAA